MTEGSRRPACHVTAPAGWINDPLGVSWHRTGDGGRYELFVQHNPDSPQWVPACQWARFAAPDLVRWSWGGTALRPAAGEAGCWSGSVVLEDDGTPVIVYTSVLAGAADVGRIALARGDAGWRRWTADPAGPVLRGPPPDLPVRHFRDPFVWRAGGGWRMAVGGGLAGDRAVALQYSAADLRTWRFDGVLAERPAGDIDPLGTGSVWECVQLFPLDGRWVLVVSAWEQGSPQRVACAVGDYDGRRFVPHAWQRFTETDAVYATTTFSDRAGRRCAISWIREPGPAGASWAGVLTLPVVLSLDGDRVALEPHPDVASLRVGGPAETRLGAATGPFPDRLHVEWVAAPGAGLVVADDAGELLGLHLGTDGVTAVRPGRRPERIAGRARGDERRIRLLLDADVAEVFAGGAAGVLRLRPPGERLWLRGTGPPGAPARVRVCELAAVLPR